MCQLQALSPFASDLLVTPPNELARMGAPCDIYNFSDLDHQGLPLAQYKLVIFLNAFLIPRDKREFALSSRHISDPRQRR
jgi:hypothetical protein